MKAAKSTVVNLLQIQSESVEGVGRGHPRDGVQLEDGGAPGHFRDHQQRDRGDERAGQVGVSGTTLAYLLWDCLLLIRS